MESNTDIDYEWDLTAEEVSSVVEESFSLELDHFDERAQEDMLWQARTGLNPETLSGAIETIIFMSDRPISIKKIKAQIDDELPLRMIHSSLSKLQHGYEEKYHGIRLVEVAEGYQFRTKATYSKFVQNLFKVNSLVLTPTALEVLAIVAYKQPISKTDVEKVRGVDSSHIIRALMDKRLVKITGRSEELGRPSLFGTTEEFLEVFNLADLSSLPPEYELEEMATKNNVGAISDIKSVVFRGDSKKFTMDEFEELDKLSENIGLIASDTSFTMLLKSEEKKKIDGDSVIRKSAFDILEDFVNQEEILRQNLAASSSENIMNIADPKVVDLTVEGVIFNAPEDLDHEFEALRALDISEAEAERAKDEPNSEESEALELEKALDMAFEQLTGEKLEKDEMEFEDIEGTINNLDNSIDQTIEKGKDLGLDLTFLTEVSTQPNESSDE
ncbi:MAG TPA: SMC-Scp complex subunit ScpB [Bacteriovoracaceae bacterium]|nr:SMC-Scp complex subunit ScpB [Bacteriovoracaceae bacterium]